MDTIRTRFLLVILACHAPLALESAPRAERKNSRQTYLDSPAGQQKLWERASCIWWLKSLPQGEALMAHLHNLWNRAEKDQAPLLSSENPAKTEHHLTHPLFKERLTAKALTILGGPKKWDRYLERWDPERAFVDPFRLAAMGLTLQLFIYHSGAGKKRASLQAPQFEILTHPAMPFSQRIKIACRILGKEGMICKMDLEHSKTDSSTEKPFHLSALVLFTTMELAQAPIGPPPIPRL